MSAVRILQSSLCNQPTEPSDATVAEEAGVVSVLGQKLTPCELQNKRKSNLHVLLMLY